MRCSTPSATCARWICRSGRSAPFCATATADFSREITMIDYGLTSDPEKFVTEIRIPVTEA
ncbi:MAG: hypothetical protein OGM61_00970 [Clostridiales bacterium]|nr:MAG: hypothetical protein OGM61_00970 [Clostridiales bacterium]